MVNLVSFINPTSPRTLNGKVKNGWKYHLVNSYLKCRPRVWRNGIEIKIDLQFTVVMQNFFRVYHLGACNLSVRQDTCVRTDVNRFSCKFTKNGRWHDISITQNYSILNFKCYDLIDCVYVWV